MYVLLEYTDENRGKTEYGTEADRKNPFVGKKTENPLQIFYCVCKYYAAFDSTAGRSFSVYFSTGYLQKYGQFYR